MRSDVERAAATIGEAVAHADQIGGTGPRFLHRIRGEILLKRNPSNTAPAEEAFLAAVAIAQQQRAKSFELQAALLLAKLYQSTGRRRRSCRACAGACRIFADAGISRD